MIARSDELTLSDVRPYLTNAKVRNGQLVAACPVCYDDHHLYLNEKNGKLLVYCQKCNAPGKEILKALRAMVPKREEPIYRPNSKSVIEEYDHEYHNPDGSVAYYKHRVKYSDGSKRFSFAYVDEAGRQVFKKPENCNNLYNLHLMQQAIDEHTTDTLYIVEGEKCADAMVRAGLLATTANTGAQKNIKLSDTDRLLLNSFPIRIVLPDNDEKGSDYANAWAGARTLPISEIWADCPPKGDVADYLEAGFPIEAITNYKFEEPISLDKDFFAECDSYRLLSKEMMEALNSITKPDERQMVLALAGLRAKELQISREFQRCWKSYMQAQAAKGIKSENMTRFPNQLFSLRCGEWEAGSNVKRLVCKGGDNYTYEIASPIPIMPTEILENVEDGTEHLRLSYFKNGAWKSLPVLRSTVASSSKIIELADAGVEVNSDNSKLLVKYLAEAIALNPDILPRTKSVSHMGWVEGSKFVPYTDEIKIDAEVQYKSLVASIAEKGTLEEWVGYVKPLRKNIYLRMILAASFASPLIAKVGALPFVLHLWGGTGSGKTVGAMVAASIWGNPQFGHLLRTMNMTVNSMMSTAAMLGNIPFFGDELQTIKSKFENYDTLIMRVCEGVDRGRMTNATLQKQATWANSFIFTGEEPCTQTASGGGVKNRVIEIECDHEVVADGNAVANFVSNHYGCVGRVFVEALKGEDLAKHYREIYQLTQQVTGTTEKQAMAMALMLQADMIASKVIFNTPGDFLTPDDIKQFVKSVAEVDVTERAFEMLGDIIAENIDKFEKAHYEPSMHACWGKMQIDGICLINKTILERELGRLGFSFEAAKKKWAAKGYIVLNSQGRYYWNASVNGFKGNFVKIDTNKQNARSE